MIKSIRTRLLHHCTASAEFFHHRALVLVFHIHGQLLKGLLFYAIDGANDNLGAGHAQLEALTAHALDEHRQVQFTTTGDAEFIRVITVFHPQGHVVYQLLLQALADLARGDELTVLARKR